MICCVRAGVCALNFMLAVVFTCQYVHIVYGWLLPENRKYQQPHTHSHTHPYIHKYPNWDSMRSANSNSMPTIIIKNWNRVAAKNISSQKNFSNPFIPFRRNKMKTLHIAWHSWEHSIVLEIETHALAWHWHFGGNDVYHQFGHQEYNKKFSAHNEFGNFRNEFYRYCAMHAYLEMYE